MAGDRVGVHLLPKHYYSSLPDYTWLRRNPSLWRPRAGMVGVNWDLDRQLDWLSDVCAEHVGEVAGLARYRTLTERGGGPGYGPIESQVLHCVIRRCRPSRIIEIGSGISTALIAEAVAMNVHDGGGASRITAIEPYPHSNLATLPDVSLIRDVAQRAPLDLFDELDDGDLLFIDSTHAVRTGSDVVRIYTEIFPRLRPGVLIHIHDITLPYLYRSDILGTPFDWQETAFVLALLTHNDGLSVHCCLSALHHDRQSALRRILPDYAPAPFTDGLIAGTGHFPSSLWLRTTRRS